MVELLFCPRVWNEMSSKLGPETGIDAGPNDGVYDGPTFPSMGGPYRSKMHSCGSVFAGLCR